MSLTSALLVEIIWIYIVDRYFQFRKDGNLLHIRMQPNWSGVNSRFKILRFVLLHDQEVVTLEENVSRLIRSDRAKEFWSMANKNSLSLDGLSD